MKKCILFGLSLILFAGCKTENGRTLSDDLKVIEIITTQNNIEAIDTSSSRIEIQDGRIVELNLIDAKIKSLPAEIGSLDSLEELFLNDNYLSELPAEIWNLKKLKILSANINSLISLPSVPEGKQALEELRLNSNQFSRLPSGLEKLENLESLEFSGNQFTVIDTSVMKLKQIEELDFSKNRISSVPENWDDLINLKKLDLSHNELTSLPVNLLDQEGIRIDISFNQLCGIPAKYHKALTETEMLWKLSQKCESEAYEISVKSRKLYHQYNDLVNRVKDVHLPDLKVNFDSKSIVPTSLFRKEMLDKSKLAHHLYLAPADCGDEPYYLDLYGDNIVHSQELGWNITFVNEGWSIGNGIRPGLTKKQVQKLLGPALHDTGRFLIYGEVYPNDPGDGTPDQFFRSTWFYFENDKLEAAHLIYYMDC